MVNFFKSTFLTIFQLILNVLKKAVCCLKRRRRLSCESVTLTNIGIIPNKEKEPELQSWGSWEDSVSVVTSLKPIDPVQQQIELYRQQKIGVSNEADVEQKIDYFQDMTPKIIKQTKLLLQPKENEKCQYSSNISLAPDPIFNSSELGVWEDSQSWEDQTQEDWNTNILIRETNRIEREKKLAEQKRKKLERESRSGRNMFITRIS